MTEITLTQKSKIDLCVKQLSCSNFKRITAPYIKKCTDIEDIDIVRFRLFELKNDKQLSVNYDVICPTCYEDKKTFHDESHIPIGEEIYCEECDKNIIVERENIWINFTPNKKYYNDELCKNVDLIKKK